MCTERGSCLLAVLCGCLLAQRDPAQYPPACVSHQRGSLCLSPFCVECVTHGLSFLALPVLPVVLSVTCVFLAVLLCVCG